MVVLGGYKQENGSRPAPVAHVGEWMNAHPGWTLEVRVWRPTEVGGAYYLAADTEIRDGVLWWTPTAADTAIEGKGRVQVWARDGEKAFAVSDVLVTQVLASISTDEQEPPTPMKPWLDKLVEQVEAARDEAAASADEAASTAAGIVTEEAARQDAESKRVAAEQARVSAESQRQQAETARADAEGKRVQAEQGRVTAEQGRVEAEAQREEAMAQHAEKIAELEADVAKKAQIDDTTVSGSEAWSSQHIVDMLCPPLEASGNPVVCYPVAGSKLGVTASWEPTQDGEGTPSPDNIRPIHGRNSVKVERCGENLIDSARVTNVSAAYGLMAQYISEKITISGIYSKNLAHASFNFMGLSYKLPPTAKLVCFCLKISGCTAASIRFTDKTYTRIAIDLSGCSNGKKIEVSFYPIAYVGSTPPATYTPYTSQITILTLPSTIYGADLQADGAGQETWALLTLDGTENWITPSSNAYYAVFGYAPSTNTNDGFCSHLPYTANGSVKSAYVNKNGVVVFYGCNTEMTVTQLKAWLAAQHTAGTPVTIAYKLADPVPFTATGGSAVKALSGTNTVLTDADAVAVIGRADPIHIIQQLQAASAASAQTLADVERAVTDI